MRIFQFLLVPISNRLVTVIDTCLCLFADEAISEHKPSNGKEKYISEIHRAQKPERSGANSKLFHAISFTKNFRGFAGEIQGTFKTQPVP